MLQKGLKILRQRGTIIKAFQQTGFFNEQVQDWHIINTRFLTTNKIAARQLTLYLKKYKMPRLFLHKKTNSLILLTNNLIDNYYH